MLRDIKSILPCCIFALTLMGSFVLPLRAQQNVILIIADDLSPDYLGGFGTSTDTANMPNLRSLANKGIRFSKVWSAPVCSPARATMLTGRYPFRTGVGGVISGTNSPQIDTAEQSISKLLRYQAPIPYHTACIGKWHLTVNQPGKRTNPNKLGFDLYSGNFNGAIPDYYQYQRVKNGTVDTVSNYASTQTVNDAVDWLDTLSGNQPFFLWLAFNAPHDPFHIPPASLCDTAGLSGSSADIAAHPQKYFKAALQAMDTEIGRLLLYLQQHQLIDSTNIVFLGDNGNQSEVAQISDGSKAKGSIYDYGLRVPLFVSGPAVVHGNRTCNDLISAADLFATIAELCGFPNWRNALPAGTITDTRSFLPQIRNQVTIPRSWMFSETFNQNPSAKDGKSIRNQDYHLLCFDNGQRAFYNQSLDAEENTNLLLDPNVMSETDQINYQLLCDSLAALTGLNTCDINGIAEPTTPEQMIIYPNPTKDAFRVQLQHFVPGKVRIQLLDVFGRNVYTHQEVSEQTTFHISTRQLPPGFYVLNLSSANWHVSRKIVVEEH